MHLLLGPSSHLSHLTISKQQYKKATETKSQNIFWMKTGACRDVSSKTNQLHHNTSTPSWHLVPFCTLCTLQTLYMHLAYSNTLNEQVTQHCSLHSLPSIHICHFQQQYNFTTHLTLQHTIQTQHCPCTPVFCMHARQIWVPVCTLYIAATHNITYSPYTSTCTTHWVKPTTLPSTILLHTQLTNPSVFV